MVFEDVHKLAKQIASMDFCVGYIAAKGGWLPQLCAALARSHVSWSVQEVLVDQHGHETLFCCGDSNAFYISKCCCGACLDCLVRCGKASAVAE